jgi:hypothetical protein
VSALTANAAAFLAANKESPVVSGAVTHKGAERPENVTGSVYELDDGRTFTLTTEECRSMPVPRWKI